MLTVINAITPRRIAHLPGSVRAYFLFLRGRTEGQTGRAWMHRTDVDGRDGGDLRGRTGRDERGRTWRDRTGRGQTDAAQFIKLVFRFFLGVVKNTGKF